jgi:WD40 repeat protein
MINDSPDPLNSSLETSNIEPAVGVANICLSSLENPSASKVRLRQLLRQVEKEFEAVLLENVALRKELERYGGLNNNTHGTTTTSRLRASNILPMIKNRVVLRTGNQSDDLIFSSTNQHQDVIWDVQAGGLDDRYFGSASADKTSIIWSRKTGRPLIQYQGHRGSVNSCRFSHFDHDLVLTASGDHEVHIWKSSIDENKDEEDEDNEMITQTIRSPLLTLRGDDVLSCADWLQRDQIVSASWDRSATIWQVS